MSATEPAERQQYVTFGVDGDFFAAPVDRVQEILDLRKISRLPHAPRTLLGMIDVRGQSIPVVDLRRCLGIEDQQDDLSTRILLLHVNLRGSWMVIGLKADRVYEVAEFDDDEREVPPDAVAPGRLEIVSGIAWRNGELVTMLDLDRLLARSGADIAARGASEPEAAETV